MNEDISRKIKLYPQEGQLPCAVAHYIAAELNTDPQQVGETANDLGVRMTQCQLGLFGYAKKGTPAYKILRPKEDVPEPLAQALGQSAADGRIACARLWEIAAQFDLSRHQVGSAANSLGLKVKPCQLGCF